MPLCFPASSTRFSVCISYCWVFVMSKREDIPNMVLTGTQLLKPVCMQRVTNLKKSRLKGAARDLKQRF